MSLRRFLEEVLMNAVRLLLWFMVTMISLEGCATTTKKMASKKDKKIHRFYHTSYALMDDDAAVDRSILQRGSKARGQSGY
jgi:uncharacterized protein YceK